MGRAAAMVVAALLSLVLGAVVPGCSEQGRKPGPLRIVVTVPPLVGLVKPLAPADASVVSLMAPGRSEHGYEFTPRDIATLGGADVVVYVGLRLEPAVEDFLRKHPSKRRRDVCFAAAAGIKEDPHAGHDHGGHDGGHDRHDHSHLVDVHLWLDTGLCAMLADAVGAAIGDASREVGAGTTPSDAAAKLKAELATLDLESRERLKPLAGRAIVTHHNAWQRLADKYGLKVAAVIRETDGEPTPGAVSEAVDAIREQGARAVFVEPQFDPEVARRISEAAGVRLGVLDPLGDGDYFGMMRKNIASLVEALGD